MKTYKDIQRTESIVDTCLCNKCGESTMVKPIEQSNYQTQIGLSIVFRGHYFSKLLDDGTDYIFDLCEKCLLQLFSTFKIPVQTSEDITNEPL